LACNKFLKFPVSLPDFFKNQNYFPDPFHKPGNHIKHLKNPAGFPEIFEKNNVWAFNLKEAIIDQAIRRKYVRYPAIVYFLAGTTCRPPRFLPRDSPGIRGRIGPRFPDPVFGKARKTPGFFPQDKT
jgi:hypothetical protein